MKKSIIFIIMAIMAIASSISAHAEQCKVSAAAQFLYASKHSMAGLGVQVQVEPATNFRLAPELNYYFKNDGLSALNASLNLHYVIHTSNVFALYPLVGFTYGHYKMDHHMGDSTKDRCGANVGLGAQYRIQDRLHFFTEARFQIMKDYNQSVTVLGLKYTF